VARFAAKLTERFPRDDGIMFALARQPRGFDP
jgi:hypothetical protein